MCVSTGTVIKSFSEIAAVAFVHLLPSSLKWKARVNVNTITNAVNIFHTPKSRLL